MNQTLEKLKSETPSCLLPFKLQDSDEVLPSDWNSGGEFITRRVSCKCGNDENRLSFHQVEETRGVFKNKVELVNTSPVYFECPACKSKKLLFSPDLHGWNGELDKLEDMSLNEDLDTSSLISTDSGHVIVNYSYQGIENYEELFEDEEILNPQDFFDIFSVYLRNRKGTIEEITTDECA